MEPETAMNTIPPDKPLPGRILVVDDEPKNRELLHDLLEVNGYSVVEAEDGLDALAKVESEQCDVILIDVMMPRMDGFEACRKFKANLATAHIPVIMVTSLVEREHRYLGIDAGANDYLTKPIDRRDVLLRVRNAVTAKRLHDKVQQDLTKLQEFEKLQQDLTHMVIHDMGSPLMIISCAYDMILMEKDRLSPLQQEYITMGQNSYRELINIVTALLDISRMESGKMPLNRTSCGLREIAAKAATAMAILSEKKKVSLRVTGDVGRVNVDRDLMYRVFVNLLGNAIKFSPADNEIEIDIVTEVEAVRATVTDQGCGVPPEFRDSIFDKFGQVGTNKEGQKHSWGLGLTFCKLVVEAHGGLIGVESPSLKHPHAPGVTDAARCAGKGSTFWVTLPKGERERETGLGE